MDQVTLVKNNARAAQWASIIRECQSSGQTVSSWCSENSVGIKAYYYWLRKLRLSTIENSNLPVVQQEEKPAVFRKLEVQTPVPDTRAAVIIRLGNATVEINEGTSQQTIQAVLLALQSVC